MNVYEIKYFKVGEFLGADIVLAKNEDEAARFARTNVGIYFKIKQIDLNNPETYPGILGNKCCL